MSKNSEDKAVYISGRKPKQIYRSRKIVSLRRTNSSDNGKNARFFYEVFDDEGGQVEVELDGEIYPLSYDKQRYQTRLLVAREAGNIKDLWIERIKNDGRPEKPKTVFHLTNTDGNIDDFITLLNTVRLLDIQIDEPKKISTEAAAEVLNNPDLIKSLYSQNSESVRQLIANDASSKDVIAIANRREKVKEFEDRLNDPDQYDEKSWQDFFEDNHWMLGANLSAQLLTSVDDQEKQKLEQIVTGGSVERNGKRPDALLSSRSVINSLVFAEIKKPNATLCDTREYRPGTFMPSRELVGGISQCLETLHSAEETLRAGHELKDKAGGVTGRKSYFFNPKSYLIIGNQKEFLTKDENPIEDRIRAFYLYRNNLHRPEIITYDELLERAKWLVSYSPKDA